MLLCRPSTVCLQRLHTMPAVARAPPPVNCSRCCLCHLPLPVTLPLADLHSYGTVLICLQLLSIFGIYTGFERRAEHVLAANAVTDCLLYRCCGLLMLHICL